MVAKIANNASATLSADIASGATTLVLAAGKGALFPTLTGSDWFPLTLVSAGSGTIELVKVTARSTATLTIVRAQDGTTAAAFVTGDLAELRFTQGAFDDLLQKSDNLAGLTDKPAARTALELGSAALAATGAFATAAQGANADSAVQPARTLTAAGLVTGGGSLAADRTITVTAATGAEVTTGTDDTHAVTPKALADAGIDIFKSKNVSLTRDMTAASGSQAVTGVGFTPRAIIFVGGVGGVLMACAVVDSALTEGGVSYDNTNFSAPNGNIVLRTSSGNNQAGVIASLDSDGFTITWTKAGSPTGTATLYALCLR